MRRRFHTANHHRPPEGQVRRSHMCLLAVFLMHLHPSQHSWINGTLQVPAVWRVSPSVIMSVHHYNDDFFCCCLFIFPVIHTRSLCLTAAWHLFSHSVRLAFCLQPPCAGPSCICQPCRLRLKCAGLYSRLRCGAGVY